MFWKFLLFIMICLIGFLLFIMIFARYIDFGGGLHCGRNNDIFIPCNGDEEIDGFIEKYKPLTTNK